MSNAAQTQWLLKLNEMMRLAKGEPPVSPGSDSSVDDLRRTQQQLQRELLSCQEELGRQQQIVIDTSVLHQSRVALQMQRLLRRRTLGVVGVAVFEWYRAYQRATASLCTVGNAAPKDSIMIQNLDRESLEARLSASTRRSIYLYKVTFV